MKIKTLTEKEYDELLLHFYAIQNTLEGLAIDDGQPPEGLKAEVDALLAEPPEDPFKRFFGKKLPPVPTPEAKFNLTGDPRKDIFELATVIAGRLSTDVWDEIKDASGFTGDSGDFVWLEPSRLRSVRKDSKWVRNTLNRLKRKLDDLALAANKEEVTF